MYKAVAMIMQLGGIVIVGVSMLPYLIVGVEFQFRLILGVFFAFLILVTMAVGWASRATVIHLITAGEDEPGLREYVNRAAMVDVALFSLLVAVTGGLTESSFVSLLFLVPVLAMLIKATRTRSILVAFTISFAILVLLEVPSINEAIQEMMSCGSWILKYKGSGAPGAYKASTILNLGMTIYAIFIQHWIDRLLERPPAQAPR